MAYWRFLFSALALLVAGIASAQIEPWQLGGQGGLAWTDNDTTRIMIDVETAPGAIQPFYITSDRSIFSYFSNWSPRKFPLQLGYVDGERPRAWKGSIGDERTVHNATYLVDGDSTTFNPPSSAGIGGIWYTIDLAVPVPAYRFGFFTPPKGYRADGSPYAQDAVPAFEVSIAPENDPALEETNAYTRVGQVIADVAENLAPQIHIDFPPQYVRFIRWQRKESILDQAYGLTESSASGSARKGTIADFELFGEGVPRRALYVTRIIDLGKEINFGRLFWSATPMRMVGGQAIEEPDADVWLMIEARTGRDADPNIYQEFDDKGREVVVDLNRFEYELKESVGYGYVASGRPGVRASIKYDSDHWTFWSSPITESGQPLRLRSGSHIQLKITLHSEDFDAFMRLDSLWVETSPLLASSVRGEVARLDEPQPAHGFTEVELGQTTDFTYDIRADFAADQRGFDAVRIRTGSAPEFKSLTLGADPVEPTQVTTDNDGLLVVLPRRITAADNAPIRIVFAAEVRVFATTFEGEVLDSTTEALPQPIEAGDANTATTTNSLRVLSAVGSSRELIEDLALSGTAFTPNGDGINDRLTITYSLFRLPQAVAAELRIYSLDGRQVAARPLGLQAAGAQRVFWDGRDQNGDLLSPGLYVLGVELHTEAGGRVHLQPVGIAY